MMETTTSSNGKLNPVSEVLAIIFGFGIAICKTYLLCLFIVTEAIVSVALAIIYGVCHTILELFRMFTCGKKKNDATKANTAETSQDCVNNDTIHQNTDTSGKTKENAID